MAHSPLDILRGEPNDKRSWRRFNIELTILVEPVSEDEPEPELRSARSKQRTALVTDISVNGLFFVSPADYPIDSLVDIQLTLGTQSYSLRGLVVRHEVRELPGRSAHGCAVQFVRTESVKMAIPAIANYILRKTAAGTATPVQAAA